MIVCDYCKTKVKKLNYCSDKCRVYAYRSRKGYKSISQLKWQVWQKDNFTCVKCGKREYLEIDHIVPLSKEGETELNNLQTLCSICNKIKSNGIAPVTKPKQTLEQSEKIIEEFVEKKKEEGTLKFCKHGAMIGLCKYS